MDPYIQTALANFGYAEVLVVLKERNAEGATAASSVASCCLKKLPSALARRRVRSFHRFPRLGVCVGFVDQAGADRLAAEKDIAGVYLAQQISPIRPVRSAAPKIKKKEIVTWGLKMLGVDKLWKEGLTGKGLGVGHLDTGVDGKHPALRKRIKGFMEFDRNGDPVPKAKPHDTDEHGTHTAGTICGGRAGGLAIGVAPQADLYSAIVIEGGRDLIRILNGMEWILGLDVRILSMSLGIRGYNPFFVEITRRLREDGVLPVFAIGNEGPGTSRSPGNYPEALSVGAMDQHQAVADFSSSIVFKRTDDPIQPNVTAPGVDVISAVPGKGLAAMDGTSMATPHVAGVAALLLQAKPEATVDEIERALFSTAVALEDEPAERYGYGLINPQAAVEYLTNHG